MTVYAERMKRIKAMYDLATKNEGAEISVFLARSCLELGICHKTALEYWTNLREARHVEAINGRVSTLAKLEAVEKKKVVDEAVENTTYSDEGPGGGEE